MLNSVHLGCGGVNMSIKRALFFLLSFVGSSCTTFPGSNISSNNFESTFSNPEISTAEASRVLITPDTIRRLKEAPAIPDKTPPFDKVGEPYTYRVGVGDILSIVVWDHPELTAPFGSFNNVEDQGNVVREDGTFYYPFVGAIKREDERHLLSVVKLRQDSQHILNAPK